MLLLVTGARVKVLPGLGLGSKQEVVHWIDAKIGHVAGDGARTGWGWDPGLDLVLVQVWGC